MGVVIEDSLFEGPFMNVEELGMRSGVFFVARRGRILQIGDTKTIRNSLAEWLPHNPPMQPYEVCVFVHYTPSLDETERKRLTAKLVAALGPLML